jgi:PD-(D/E)XK nuclease superfamily
VTEINTLFNEGGPSGQGYSEVEAYLRCPKEYQYAKVRGIGKPQSQTPDYFAVGTFLHAGRARWFASKFATSAEVWQQMRDDVSKTRSELPLPCSDAAESTALRYLQEYVDHWGVRPLPKPVAVEHLLGPTKLEQHERTARLDDFGFYPEAGGKLAIGELKTTSAPISDVANQYTLHGQPLLQRILWDSAPQGAATFGSVAGMVLDVVQKGYGGKRCTFGRLFVEMDDRPLAWYKAALARALAEKELLTWNSEPERRITSCTRLIGKARVACEFRDMCQSGRAGAIGFVTADGAQLADFQPSPGKEAMPWD